MTLDFNNLTIEQLILLNKIYLNLQEDFNKLVEKLLNHTNKDIAWLVSIVVSRHAYQSELYHHIVKLKLASELIKINDISKIVFPNKILKDVFIFNNPNTKIDLDYKKNRNLGINIFKDIYRVLRMVYRERISKNRKRREEIIRRDIILVDTFILGDSIKAGRYIDRYYNGVLDFLTENECKRIYFLPTFIGKYNRNSLKKIYNNSQENFLFKQDFLKITDYLISLIKLLVLKFPPQRFSLEGNDITGLIKYEFIEKRFNGSSFQGILNYLFIKRLRKNNIKISLLIDWNENQPIDKGLIKGIKDFYPNTYTKGYQGYIISTDFNFYIQPTNYEINNGVIPDEICVIGKGLEDFFLNATKKIKISSSPAFRFQNVFKEFEKIKENKKILVALPIGFDESYDILKLVSVTVNEMKKLNFEIFIKPHPSLNMGKLKQLLGRYWKPDFNIIEGDFNECVSQVNLLIGSSSSSLVEALTRGVPVIVIGSQRGITQNPIPKSTNKLIWKLVFDSKELADVISYNFNLSENERERIKEIGKEIKEKCFIPATKENVKAFLNLS